MDLPYDILERIAGNLHGADVINLSLVFPKVDRESFWHKKFIQDLNYFYEKYSDSFEAEGNWKELYYAAAVGIYSIRRRNFFYIADLYINSDHMVNCEYLHFWHRNNLIKTLRLSSSNFCNDLEIFLKSTGHLYSLPEDLSFIFRKYIGFSQLSSENVRTELSRYNILNKFISQ